MPKRKTKKTNSAQDIQDFFGQDLIEQALLGVFKIDLKHDKMLYANRILARFFGYDSVASLKRAKKTIPFKNYTESKEFFTELKKTKKLDDFELEVINRKGEYRVFLVNAREKDKVLSGMMVDITDRRMARLALIDSEARYRDIVQNSPDMIHAVDDKGHIVFSNRREAQLLGYNHQELIGMHINKIYTTNLWNQVQKGFRRLRREGTLFVANGKMKKKNGDEIDVEINSLAIYDKKHHFLHTRSIIHDVTERKKSEEALRKSEQKWRTLVESSPDFILMIDRESKIQFINKLQPGFKMEEVIGSPAYNYVPKASRARFKKMVANAFKTGRSHKEEMQGDGPYGKPAYYSTRVAPVKHNGKVEFVILFSTDITEQRTIQEELKNKVEQMEFMGRLNLRRHKKMRELEKELKKLQDKFNKLNPPC